jgi:hypothetical protein
MLQAVDPALLGSPGGGGPARKLAKLQDKLEVTFLFFSHCSLVVRRVV